MASSNKKGHQEGSMTRNWSIVFSLILAATALALALFSYHSNDPSLNTFNQSWEAPKNMLGYIGSWTSDLYLQAFGWSAWSWPLLMFAAAIRWIFSKRKKQSPLAMSHWWISMSLFLLASTLALDIFPPRGIDAFPVQGLVGITTGKLLRPLMGDIGSFLFVLLLLWSFCMIWWRDLPLIVAALIRRSLSSAGRGAQKGLGGVNSILRLLLSKLADFLEHSWERRFNKKIKIQTESHDEDSKLNSQQEDDSSWDKQPLIRQSPYVEKPESPAPTRILQAELQTNWEMPPISLLEKPKNKGKSQSQEELLQTAQKIVSALSSFDIDGEIVEISPGPIITMYEFQPAPGIRVQKLVSISTDLAMTLGVPSIRIVAPIPGKSVAGIEVPNPDKEDIVLRDVYEATAGKTQNMKLPLVLGKDGEGRPVVEDLSRMPHLLVGGATNMGKSVLVNSLLTALLLRFSPQKLRLIIVDPKLVEFKVYEDIPHLLLPIVNDANDASQALKWAVSETKRRYLLMQKISAKNLEAYNKKVSEMNQVESEESEEEIFEEFPHIVIIVDELAELMFSAKKDVEQSIVRLTQLARAAGIHLIMATQRPSADVVTGLIKSNCPSRAALRVASSSDSRIILDCSGAEQLLGRGDMFFTNTGPMGLRRMQGCFVSDSEVEKVCDFWRDQGEPSYHQEILEEETNKSSDLQDCDPLFNDVVLFSREKGSVSTSLIQRRFQIGYTRAARIMEQLEEAGIVGEAASAGKAREVLA